MTHSFETVTSVEDNRRQNYVEEDFRVERRLQIDFIQIPNQLTSKGVSIGSVLCGCGVIERAGKLKPQTIRWKAFIVTR